MINRDPEGQIKNIKHTHIFYIVGMFYLMNLAAVIFARRLKWLGRINFNGKSQFLIWPRWKDLSLYFWYDNILTGTLTVMLGGIRGRRSGRQKMRWLEWVTSSMDMILSKLQEFVMDPVAWCASIHGITKSWTWLRDWTELNCLYTWLT